MAGKFEPKVPVELAPPKDDIISAEELANANGTIDIFRLLYVYFLRRGDQDGYRSAGAMSLYAASHQPLLSLADKTLNRSGWRQVLCRHKGKTCRQVLGLLG